MFAQLSVLLPVAVNSRTNDFNFQVPRSGSSASAIVEERSSISAVNAARLFMTTSFEVDERSTHGNAAGYITLTTPTVAALNRTIHAAVISRFTRCTTDTPTPMSLAVAIMPL